MRKDVGHLIKDIERPEEGNSRTERHESIHIRRAMGEGFPAGKEEIFIDMHHDEGKEHFRQSKSQMIMVKKCGNGPAEHIVPHGDIHEEHKKYGGPYEAPFELRRFMVGQGFRFLCQFF